MSTAKQPGLAHVVAFVVFIAVGWPAAALAQGSFLHRQPPPQTPTQSDTPSTAPATPAAPTPAPAEQTPVPAASSVPAAALPSPLQPSGPAPVTHVQEIPIVDWVLAALYSANEQGLDTLPRSFLTDWVALTDCSAWHAAQNNEFAMEDQRQNLRKSLSVDVGQIPARVRISVKARLGEYDFDRGGYPSPAPQAGVRFTVPVTESCRGFYPGRVQPGMPSSYELGWTDNPDWAPLLVVSRDRAQQISEKLGPNRQVITDYVVEFVSLDKQRLNNGSPAAILVRPIAMFVWADEKREQFIGAVGDVAPGAEIKASLSALLPSTAPTSNTPTAGRVDSYSPEGWPIINGKALPLAGIEPIPVNMIKALSSYITANGGYLECALVNQGKYQCLTKQAVDIVQAILVNGAARATADASQVYRDAQQQAQTAKRGVWK